MNELIHVGAEDEFYKISKFNLKEIVLELIIDFYNKKDRDIIKTHVHENNLKLENHLLDQLVDEIFEDDLIYYIYIIFLRKYNIQFRMLLMPTSNDISKLFHLLKIDINE